MTADNLLYYGDNLPILRDYIHDESVDLVYLDPPFNSNATYNVLFAEHPGTPAAAQIKAFEDTWQWNTESARDYEETVEQGGKVADALRAFRILLGQSNMMAYLAMMAPRLVELRRVLKPTGSLYLHCDPTASHYLKILLDAIFEPRRFLNEIVWQRSSAHSDTKQGMRRCGKVHDVLLLYTKSNEYSWTPIFTPYASSYVESEYRHLAADGRQYKETDLTAAKPGGDTEYEWRVKRPIGKSERWSADLANEYLSPGEGWEYRGVRPYKGRYWAYSLQNMIDFARKGWLIHRETGVPRLMQFSESMPGIPLQDVWTDIPPEAGTKALGYPTQKPEALLERIIRASSNEGDTVLDPFCGCGTAVAVAQRLNRRWIGIDITHLAINLVRLRLHDAFGDTAKFRVIGEPVSVPDAQQLADTDPYQFQWWALGLVDARPADQKKGSDKGIDGRKFFHDEPNGKTKQIIFSVKAGTTGPSHVRDLVGVLSREKAEIGVLISMRNPTGDMRKEAASAGFYESPVTGQKHARLQILTIADLLNGKRVDYPRYAAVEQFKDVTFKKAPKAKPAKTRPLPLPEDRSE